MTGLPPVELSVGAIVIDDRDRLLMVRRGREPAAGQWSVPGGRVEPGETLAEAVLREVQEETRIAVICGALAGHVERIDENYHFVILDFFATTLDPAEPVAGDDAAEAAWVPLAEVGERNLVEGLGQFLLDVGVIDRVL